MSDHLLIPRELVSRIRQHLAELRELNADLTWTDVSEVAELDALKPAQPQTQWVPTLHKDGTTTVEPRQFYEESGTITKEQFGNLLPPEPTVLVEALEDIAIDDGVDETSAKIAREALAEYRGER
jgi:hypothetical protein